MRRAARLLAVLPFAAFAPMAALAQEAPQAPDRDQGRAAWSRIHEVVSHPRCANSHVGPDNIPVWSGPSYGETRPHGMNIDAGASRIGAETLLCASCHITRDTSPARPHAAPGANADWRLPPPGMQWHDRSSAAICAQMRDPDRTGGRDGPALARHIIEDAAHRGLVFWGWAPGGGRVPAPYTPEAHAADILT